MGYVAPEILACRAYDTKADIWSLGVLLYIMLTLRFPFDPTEVSEKITLQQQNDDESQATELLDLDTITQSTGGATDCADLLSQML